MLCTWTQMEHGNQLGAGIDGEPEPQHLFGAAQPCAQFIQLEIRKLEMTEKVLVEALSMLPSTGEPGSDGGLSVAEDTRGLGSVQPFGQPRRAPWRSGARGFSNGTGACCDGRVNVVRQA
jgi:hypothetical protein